MDFKDLKFDNKDLLASRARHFFDNHYGVSVVRGPYSYGGRDGLYELAVMHMAPGDENSELVYDTPITNDVIGYLTPEEVTDLMKQVSELPLRDIMQ